MLRGHFLVASPYLPDTNFYRSVVLILHHDDEGAFGLVINRPTNNSISDVWEMLSEEPCTIDMPIYLGGPVPGPLMAVHTDIACNENEVLEGIYYASDQDHIAQLLEHHQHPFRLFSGYAGWGAGQLESELEVGGWLTTPATEELIFSDPDEVWKNVARTIGLDVLSPSLKAAPMPDDPSVN